MARALCTAFILARARSRSDDTPVPGAGTGAPGSELGEHRIGRAHVEARGRLDHQLADHAVLEDGGIALRPGAEAEAAAIHLEAHLGGELAVAVGQHEHGVAGVLRLAPGPHDEHVVDGQAGDRVDALGPQVVGPQHEPGQAVVGAGGGEGAGPREQDDPPLAQHVAALHGAGTFVGHRHELDVGDGVADRDRHRSSSRAVGRTPRSCRTRGRFPTRARQRPGRRGRPGRRRSGVAPSQMRRPTPRWVAALYTSRAMIAPMMEPTTPEACRAPSPTSLPNRTYPRNPPMNDPTTPRTAVWTKDMGSRPGTSSRAR